MSVRPAAQYGTEYSQTGAVVVTQPMIPVIEYPVRMRCHYCQADIVTATSYETGTCTWIACVVLFVSGASLGCCFIPFCLNSCKDVVHECPHCHQVVGKYKRMQ